MSANGRPIAVVRCHFLKSANCIRIPVRRTLDAIVTDWRLRLPVVPW